MMEDLSQYAHFGLLAIAIGGVVWNNSRIAAKNEASAKAARAIADEAKVAATAAAKQADELKDRFAEFREYVALKYVQTETLEKTERAIIAAINRLGDRFDRYVDQPHAVEG
jgi:predicted translin family RNA/ssDNA-binding protein